MDILSVTLTAFGAFGAGVTVGAVAFSPRLLTVTRRPHQEPPRDPAPVVYVVPGDSSHIPAGVIPSGPVGHPAIVTLAVPGTPGLPSITAPGMTAVHTPDPQEGQR